MNCRRALHSLLITDLDLTLRSTVHEFFDIDAESARLSVGITWWP